jgi:hypothetical protein
MLLGCDISASAAAAVEDVIAGVSIRKIWP